MILTNDL